MAGAGSVLALFPGAVGGFARARVPPQGVVGGLVQ